MTEKLTPHKPKRGIPVKGVIRDERRVSFPLLAQ
jgi:hypothetical protein